MQIQKFTFNPFQENTYVCYDSTKECIIIDPGCYFQHEIIELTSFIVENNLTPVRLINTHAHIDHICGVQYVKEKWNLNFECSRLDEYNIDWSVQRAKEYNFPISMPSLDIDIVDGQMIEFGDSVLRTIFTPGHSSGSMSFYHEADGLLINGDVLFKLSIGRHDFPGGDYGVLMQSITDKLFHLPDDTIVYSGHGEETTIGYEKTNNPFVQEYLEYRKRNNI